MWKFLGTSFQTWILNLSKDTKSLILELTNDLIIANDLNSVIVKLLSP